MNRELSAGRRDPPGFRGQYSASRCIVDTIYLLMWFERSAEKEVFFYEKICSMLSGILSGTETRETLTTAAMLMAVSVVLGYFTIEAGPYLKIGFGGVVNQFVYYLFGPVAGAVYGGVLDLVKYVVKPTGAFFPGFTLNAMLGGVLYGTILYRKPLTFRRALWADLVVALICNIFLNTLWLSMMSGKAMMVLLPMRVLKNLIKWPVDAALFYLIAKRMESLGLVRMIRKFQAE